METFGGPRNKPTPASVCGQHPRIRAWPAEAPVVFLLHVRPFAPSKAEATGSPQSTESEENLE